MIKAKHTIMLPGKVLAPGDTAELSTADADRLIAGGFAVAVEVKPAPAADEAAGKEPRGNRHK